ncbi:MAG: hypothetical protein E7F06_06530 [Lachnospiraceae bacterium]|nr:hypothetical protein [Lachnospiraceae bacterium]
MEIIEKLYNVCSELRETDDSREKTEFKGSQYLALKEKLTPELAEELESLVDEILFSNLDELERNFKEGFCMSAELMLVFYTYRVRVSLNHQI